MNSVLAKTVDQDYRNWDRLLPSVMAAYRATVHSSTGYSPNRLILGHENVMPIDLVLGKVVEESEHFDSYNSYVKDQQERLRVTYQLAREHLGSAAERRKIDYDTRSKRSALNLGIGCTTINPSVNQACTQSGPACIPVHIASWMLFHQLTT